MNLINEMNSAHLTYSTLVFFLSPAVNYMMCLSIYRMKNESSHFGIGGTIWTYYSGMILSPSVSV